MTRAQKIDTAVISLICLTSILLWLPTRNLPYHWDSAAFVIPAARSLLETNFQPLIAPYSEFAHPPLYPLLIANFWRFFGINRFITHLTILPFGFLLLLNAYFLGKKIASTAVGIWATVLVAVTPFFLAELGLPYIDLVAGALGASSLTLWLYRRYWLSSFILTLAVLTKNTMILLLIPLLADLIISRQKLISFAPLLPPILATFLWLLYHYTQTGWWLTAPGRDTVFPSSLFLYLNSLRFVSTVFLLRQYRFLLTLTALFSSLYLYLKHPKKIRQILFHPKVIPLLLVPGSLLFIFAATGEFIPRYALAILPAYMVCCSYFILNVIPKPFNHLALLVIILAFLFSLNPHSPTPANALEIRVNEDLSFKDHIQLGLLAAQYLAKNYPQATVVGSFPQTYQLTDPEMGYVTTPLLFVACDSITIKPLNHPTILYLHPYHYTQLACQNLLTRYQWQPLKSFNVNGKWVRLFLYEK